MSTPISEIIVRAFRDGQFLTEEASTAEELQEAIPILSRILGSVFSFELRAQLKPWSVTASWDTAQEERHPLTPMTSGSSTSPWRYPPGNTRFMVRITANTSIYLPKVPQDGERIAVVNLDSSANLTLHANGLLIDGANLLTSAVASLHGKEWFFRADLGEWQMITGLDDIEDTLPFPPEHDDYFITALAIQLAPRFSAEIPQSVVDRFASAQTRLVAQYREATIPSPTEMRAMMRTTP